jgi:release factor glutamine methyltransferase
MHTTFFDLLEEFQQCWTPLPDKPEETPERALSALWHTAVGKPTSADRATPSSLPALDEGALGRLRLLLEQRKSGIPLAHLTERQTFLGLELLAGPQALIPRKETEILGRIAIGKLTALARTRRTLTVLDVCTGSGNLALAYAWHVPRTRVFASDLCRDAVALARRNCEHLGLGAKVEMRQGDLLEPFDEERFLGRCDFISSNPPYISASKLKELHPEIARHEPAVAFDGGVYGVSILRRLIAAVPRFLKPDSWFGVEVGVGQGVGVAQQLLTGPAFAVVETHRDARGEIRAVFARSQPGR